MKTWCIPPTANADFVYHMEDVLQVYQLPYDRRYPVVCMDEASKQLIGEVNVPLPLRAGRVKCEDYEYERKRVCNQFMCCEPLRGWRHVRVTARRTKRDWAECIRELVNVHYPEATRIRLVLDNLNTHTGASLYEAFSPDEARRLLDRLEIHHTPKHASWLNMAEIEIGVLQSQCLNRRLDNADWLCSKSVPGKNDATNNRSKSIGVSPSPSPGINLKNSIRSLHPASYPHEKEPVNRRLSDY